MGNQRTQGKERLSYKKTERSSNKDIIVLTDGGTVNGKAK